MQRLLLYIGRKLAGTAPVFFLTWCFLSVSLGLQAGLHGKYTEQHPVVVMCDWEFPPYEFSNDNGQPDGFNVELLQTILQQMKLPYKFVMKESFQVAEAFERHEADLVIDAVSRFRSAPYYMSRSILNYYKIVVAQNVDTPVLESFVQLDRSKHIMLKSYDYATRDMMAQIVPDADLAYHSANEALINVSTTGDYFFVWGEEPMKWYLKEMHLTNIRVTDFGIPVGEIHVVGYDKQLIDEIDDRYARLEQSGMLELLRDKWFHPERIHNDTSPVVVYVVLGILFFIAVLFMLNRLAKRRATSATLRTNEIGSMMLQALSISQYSIFVFDPKTQRFSNLHGNLIPAAGVGREELLDHIHPDQRKIVSYYFAKLLKMEQLTADVNLRWRPFELKGQPVADTADPWQYMQGHAIVESDDGHEASRVICTVKYVTDEVRQEQENSQLGSRYNRIFDTSLVAMSFYDKDGWLIDLNQKMRELCGFDEEGERYFRETNLFDNPYFRDDFPKEQREQFYACQHMHYADVGLDRYLELKIRPVMTDNGELIYYAITARDVTDERTIHMEQRRHDHELQKVNRQILDYEEQLHYLLEHSDMWVWRSDVRAKVVTFSRSLRKTDFSVTFEDFLDGFVPEMREDALRSFGNLQGVDKNFNATYEFNRSPVAGKHQWLNASGIPLYDETGRVTGHFGIVRDVTTLMKAQGKLREETRRADESGKLKSVFLANMTHEIRTPLNAIVGFSDLLQVVDEPSDRREFIRIIRNNCDMLLRLIDDIIEASNMNQGPIAIEAREVDFAQAFSDICQTLAQRVQEPGVEFLVDNPYQSFVTCIDKGRMQQVITNFTTNAVKYTHQGHIRVGYRFENGGIYMYCEDTGTGIPKEKQAAVFDRFVKLNDYVQGTGLGLSICKSIADRCGGRIGVDSEGEGHGCTFWIWIPCEQLQHPSHET